MHFTFPRTLGKLWKTVDLLMAEPIGFHGTHDTGGCRLPVLVILTSRPDITDLGGEIRFAFIPQCETPALFHNPCNDPVLGGECVGVCVCAGEKRGEKGGKEITTLCVYVCVCVKLDVCCRCA